MILKRIAQTPDGVFGVLLDNGAPFALTLEKPWRENRQDVSCIPDGSYECRRVKSPRFGDTFEVAGVPGRTHILFHKGNTEDDSRGCILVGEQFEDLGGRLAILHSGKGFGELMARTADLDAFVLDIVWRL